MARGRLFRFFVRVFFLLGREGVLNGDKVQNTGCRCESLVLKFVGQVAEPTLELGLEKPRT